MKCDCAAKTLAPSMQIDFHRLGISVCQMSVDGCRGLDDTTSLAGRGY